MSALLAHKGHEIAEPAQPAVPTDLFDISTLLVTLWRSRTTLAFAATLGAVLGIAWVEQIATPYFQSTTVLVLNDADVTSPSFGSLVPGLGGASSEINTEVEKLRARPLLGLVINELNLRNDPEFYLPPTATTPVKIRLFLAKIAPEIFPLPKLEFSPEEIRTATIDQLARAVTIRNVPDSMVFEIVVDTQTAAKSTLIADAIARHHIARQIATKVEKNQQAVEWLGTRVAELEIDLEKRNVALAAFSAAMELVTPETLEVLSANLKDLREKITFLEAASQENPDARKFAQLTSLRTLVRNLSDKLDRQSTDLLTLRQLESEAAAATLIHTQYLERFGEAVAKLDLAQADSTILSPAETAGTPDRPRGSLVIIFVALLGVILAAIRTLLRETSRTTFRSPQELEAEFRLPVLGQLFVLPRQKSRNPMRNGNSAKHSKCADALTHLRSSILDGPRPTPQVILTTSPLADNGLSFLTLSLAHSMANLGRRILIVDCDLRGANIARSFVNFPEKPDATLDDVLRDKRPASDAVWHHKNLGVDMLTGQIEHGNPADLLHQASFRRLIRFARDNYDMVLINGPPILAAPEARIIGPVADAILLAVQWDRTTKAPIDDALRILRQSGLRIAGFVLTQVNEKKLRHYGLAQVYDP